MELFSKPAAGGIISKNIRWVTKNELKKDK